MRANRGAPKTCQLQVGCAKGLCHPDPGVAMELVTGAEFQLNMRTGVGAASPGGEFSRGEASAAER